MDNGRGPFSMTLIATPRWDRIDDISGGAVSGYGGTLAVAIDKELIANRLFGAVNVLYDTEAARLIVADTWRQNQRSASQQRCQRRFGPCFSSAVRLIFASV